MQHHLDSLARAAVIAGLLAACLFLALPQIDIAVARLFYREGAGFPVATAGWAEHLRAIFGWAMGLTIAAALALFLRACLRPTNIPARLWGLVLLAFTIGPGLIVNVILKNNWGRARPADVEAFGGELRFTPPIVMSDQCGHNCSFVSGEGSGIATLCLLAVIVIAPMLATRSAKLWLVAGATGLTLLGAGLRVLKGRHFLSDTIFAVVIATIVIWALYRLMKIEALMPRLTWAALKGDLAGFWRDLARLVPRRG
ncbi:phosphatase PAP2 family protein [Oceanomicrobium pacificus]|uniref:Phosphatase PAP2 family protein n=1 Tax=Oceanomicrobium pacificus TaxID=2692916 RepID=A0A6B0TRM6_9RHOB|nr:phosphatase PAP2 family protein [Oceanomicrobium pacificus]MXU64465.1 phosphatase PAP2 family protein [Oceanomicrobium pacificus]